MISGVSSWESLTQKRKNQQPLCGSRKNLKPTCFLGEPRVTLSVLLSSVLQVPISMSEQRGGWEKSFTCGLTRKTMSGELFNGQLSCCGPSAQMCSLNVTFFLCWEHTRVGVGSPLSLTRQQFITGHPDLPWAMHCAYRSGRQQNREDAQSPL